jgi:hypothetical protein
MAEELNGSSDVLRNQVIELQTRTRNFRLITPSLVLIHSRLGHSFLQLARALSDFSPLKAWHARLKKGAWRNTVNS